MERLHISNEWGVACIYKFRVCGWNKEIKWDVFILFLILFLVGTRNSWGSFQSPVQKFPIVSYSFSSTGHQKNCKFRKKFRRIPPAHLKAMTSPRTARVGAGWRHPATSSSAWGQISEELPPEPCPQAGCAACHWKALALSSLSSLVSGCASWWCDVGQLVFYAIGLLSHQASMFMVNNFTINFLVSQQFGFLELAPQEQKFPSFAQRSQSQSSVRCKCWVLFLRCNRENLE